MQGGVAPIGVIAAAQVGDAEGRVILVLADGTSGFFHLNPNGLEAEAALPGDGWRTVVEIGAAERRQARQATRHAQARQITEDRLGILRAGGLDGAYPTDGFLGQLQQLEDWGYSADAGWLRAALAERRGSSAEAAYLYQQILPHFIPGEQAPRLAADYGQLLERLGQPGTALALYQQVAESGGEQELKKRIGSLESFSTHGTQDGWIIEGGLGLLLQAVVVANNLGVPLPGRGLLGTLERPLRLAQSRLDPRRLADLFRQESRDDKNPSLEFEIEVLYRASRAAHPLQEVFCCRPAGQDGQPGIEMALWAEDGPEGRLLQPLVLLRPGRPEGLAPAEHNARLESFLQQFAQDSGWAKSWAASTGDILLRHLRRLERLS